MNPETLKEYLVKIGWNIDEQGMRSAGSTINSFVDKMKAKTGSLSGGFIIALSAIASAVYKVNSEMAELIDTMADADLATEKLAKRYWTTEENARSFSTALDVLGESYDDIYYMTEEQYSRLIELNKLGKTLEAPPALDDFLVKVRDIQFEFSKFKMLVQYGTRWVGYYISEFMGTDIEDVREFFGDINKFVMNNMPRIAKGIANFFMVFYRLGKAALVVVKALGRAVLAIFDLFDNNLGKATAAVGGFFLLLKGGPIVWFITLLTTLLLLVDDYLTWQRGGKSALDWSAFDEQFGDLASTIGDLKTEIKEAFEYLGEFIDLLHLDDAVASAFQMFIEAIANGVGLIADDLDRVNSVVKNIKSGEWGKAFSALFGGETEGGTEGWLKERYGKISDFWQFFGNLGLGGMLGENQSRFFGLLDKFIRPNATAARTYLTPTAASTSSTVNDNRQVNFYGSIGSTKDADEMFNKAENYLSRVKTSNFISL